MAQANQWKKFALKIHFGGFFNEDKSYYHEVSIEYVDGCHYDKFSIPVLRKILSKLGVICYSDVYYLKVGENLPDGLVCLDSEDKGLEMCRIVDNNVIVDLYVVNNPIGPDAQVLQSPIFMPLLLTWNKDEETVKQREEVNVNEVEVDEQELVQECNDAKILEENKVVQEGLKVVSEEGAQTCDNNEGEKEEGVNGEEVSQTADEVHNKVDDSNVEEEVQNCKDGSKVVSEEGAQTCDNNEGEKEEGVNGEEVSQTADEVHNKVDDSNVEEEVQNCKDGSKVVSEEQSTHINEKEGDDSLDEQLSDIGEKEKSVNDMLDKVLKALNTEDNVTTRSSKHKSPLRPFRLIDEDLTDDSDNVIKKADGEEDVDEEFSDNELLANVIKKKKLVIQQQKKQTSSQVKKTDTVGNKKRTRASIKRTRVDGVGPSGTKRESYNKGCRKDSSQKKKKVSEPDEDVDEESTTDDDYIIDSDIDLSEGEDDQDYNIFIDADVEVDRLNVENDDADASEGDSDDVGGGTDSDEYIHDSEDLSTASSSSGTDEDGKNKKLRKKKMKYPLFKPSIDMQKPRFVLGLTFANASDLRQAVRTHAIRKVVNIKFVKNDWNRIRVVCKGAGCGWFLYASHKEKVGGLVIMSLCNKHSCGKNLNHKHVTAKFLANTFKDMIRLNLYSNVSVFQQLVHRDYSVNVSTRTCYRAYKSAKSMIEAEYKDQYKKLFDYAAEIRRSNPGSTVAIETTTDEVTGVERFQRIYVCLEGCRKGFLEGCRKVVGVDGCHLKGPHPGVILTAVGIDGNNCIFPILYCVAEKEDSNSWRWFFNLLIQDLGITNQEEWTFISDRQKGLLQVMSDMLPDIEHRHCVRHLYNNFKIKHPGMALKDKVWEAARAPTEYIFNEVMAEIKNMNEEAFNWLSNLDPKTWTRSHFSTVTKCDLLLNNICESYNNAIKKVRDKSIILILEGLRMYNLKRLQSKRAWMTKYEGDLCPKVRKLVNKGKTNSGKWHAVFCGEMKFEVRNLGTDSYAVDLDTNSCPCRRWELSGIPCFHAIASIQYIGKDPENYVHECYSKVTYMKAYTPMIYPINGPKMWPSTRPVSVEPPVAFKLVGRPKRARTKEADEDQVKKWRKERTSEGVQKMLLKGTSHKCAICKGEGHNKRSCKANLSTTEQETVGLEVIQGDNEVMEDGVADGRGVGDNEVMEDGVADGRGVGVNAAVDETPDEMINKMFDELEVQPSAPSNPQSTPSEPENFNVTKKDTVGEKDKEKKPIAKTTRGSKPKMRLPQEKDSGVNSPPRSRPRMRLPGQTSQEAGVNSSHRSRPKMRFPVHRSDEPVVDSPPKSRPKMRIPDQAVEKPLRQSSRIKDQGLKTISGGSSTMPISLEEDEPGTQKGNTSVAPISPLEVDESGKQKQKTTNNPPKSILKKVKMEKLTELLEKAKHKNAGDAQTNENEKTSEQITIDKTKEKAPPKQKKKISLRNIPGVRFKHDKPPAESGSKRSLPEEGDKRHPEKKRRVIQHKQGVVMREGDPKYVTVAEALRLRKASTSSSVKTRKEAKD